MSIVLRFAFVASATVLLAGCPGFGIGGGDNIIPAMKQLPAETQVLLAKNGMKQESPIFMRIFKQEAQLEVWKAKDDGRYYHFKTYPICTFSGDLGPKIVTGDKQSPEGFYAVTPGLMNPNSQYHLSFNLGFPNAYDKANGRTGDALMVHGNCRSVGCYAMTDALIEEIYALARESFRGGQSKFYVHAFPFRMTEENMQRNRDSKWYGFWKTLKQGYDDFEVSRIPPKISVCSKQYLVNVEFTGRDTAPDPGENCPAYRKAPVSPFNPFDGQIMAKAQPAQAVAAETNRVAAYSTPSPTVAAIRAPAAPAGPQAQPAALSSQPAAVAPPPAKVARTAPAPSPRVPQAEQRPVSLAGAVAMQPPPQPPSAQDDVQPVVATFAPSPPTPEPESQDPEKTEVTRGLHNVVESGKGDMIAPGSQAR